MAGNLAGILIQRQATFAKTAKFARMRTALAIMLASMMVLPFVGVFAWLHVQKTDVRREVKHILMQGVDRSELTYIALAKADAAQLRWEHSEEFEYRSELYDVVHRSETADSLHFWCWWDRAETTLNRRLHRLASLAWATGTGKQSRKQGAGLIALFKQLAPIQQMEYQVPPTALLRYKHSPHTPALLKTEVKPPLLPPERAQV
jgi:hypothetical protein